MKPSGHRLAQARSDDNLPALHINPVRAGNHPIIVRCEQKIIRQHTLMPSRNRNQIVNLIVAIDSS